MLARKMSSGVEQHGLLQSEYLEDLASQETGDQGQRVNRQSVRHQPGIFWNDQIFSLLACPDIMYNKLILQLYSFKRNQHYTCHYIGAKLSFKISIGLNISLLRILQWSSKYWALCQGGWCSWPACSHWSQCQPTLLSHSRTTPSSG